MSRSMTGLPAAARSALSCRTQREHLGRGIERGIADRSAAAREREGREQAVAQELQHLAAMLDDHRHQAVEIVVQHLDQHFALGAVGDRGEAAQVGIEDHRLDHLEHAAPDLAVEDAPAGLRADIGVEQIDRDVVAEPRLQASARRGIRCLSTAMSRSEKPSGRFVAQDESRPVLRSLSPSSPNQVRWAR